MEYYAKSRYDTIPTENSSWGRPVRVKSTARVEEWRKVGPCGEPSTFRDLHHDRQHEAPSPTLWLCHRSATASTY